MIENEKLNFGGGTFEAKGKSKREHDKRKKKQYEQRKEYKNKVAKKVSKGICVVFKQKKRGKKQDRKDKRIQQGWKKNKVTLSHI